MPASVVKAVAKAYGKPVASIESYWDRAKKEGGDRYGVVMKIFKNIIKAELGSSGLKELGWKLENSSIAGQTGARHALAQVPGETRLQRVVASCRPSSDEEEAPSPGPGGTLAALGKIPTHSMAVVNPMLTKKSRKVKTKDILKKLLSAQKDEADNVQSLKGDGNLKVTISLEVSGLDAAEAQELFNSSVFKGELEETIKAMNDEASINITGITVRA